MEQEYDVLNQKVIFSDIEESLGMGGPFTGKLKINHKFINGLFVVNEPILYQNFLVFVKMNEGGRWRRKVKFSVFIYDIENNRAYESLETFKFLSILSLDGQMNIEAIKSFSSIGEKIVLKFNEKNFKKME